MLQTGADSQQLKNRLSGLESDLRNLGGMSMAQNKTMMEILAQIHELKASAVHAHEMFTPKASSPDNSEEEKAENHTDDDHASNELSESIDRLCGLATKPRTTAFSDEAQQIIADLEKILSLISREEKSLETRETRKRKRNQLADLESAEESKYSKQGLGLDLKRLQGLLTSSPCISVNEQGRLLLDFQVKKLVDFFEQLLSIQKMVLKTDAIAKERSRITLQPLELYPYK